MALVVSNMVLVGHPTPVAGRAGAAAGSGCLACRGVTHLGRGWLQRLLCTSGAYARAGSSYRLQHTTPPVLSRVTSGGGLLCKCMLSICCQSL